MKIDVRFKDKKKEESFKNWEKDNASLIHKIEKLDNDVLVMNLCLLLWEQKRWMQIVKGQQKHIAEQSELIGLLEEVSRQKDINIVGHQIITDVLPAYTEIQKLKGRMEFEKENSERLNVADIMSKNLDIGRKRGTEARTSEKLKKETNLNQAIADLFKNGDGWKMDNESITDFIMQRGIVKYKRSTLLNKVKRITARIKKEEKIKLGQKNSF